MKPINDIENKRGRGRPATDATPVLVRMPPIVIAKLDAWIEHQGEAISRPDAIRRLVEIGLNTTPLLRGTRSLRGPTARDLAATQIDRMGDANAWTDEQAVRKRRLLKGPQEFRDSRVDVEQRQWSATAPGRKRAGTDNSK
jgi:hypothetical protein